MYTIHDFEQTAQSFNNLIPEKIQPPAPTGIVPELIKSPSGALVAVDHEWAECLFTKAQLSNALPPESEIYKNRELPIPTVPLHSDRNSQALTAEGPVTNQHPHENIQGKRPSRRYAGQVHSDVQSYQSHEHKRPRTNGPNDHFTHHSAMSEEKDDVIRRKDFHKFLLYLGWPKKSALSTSQDSHATKQQFFDSPETVARIRNLDPEKKTYFLQLMQRFGSQRNRADRVSDSTTKTLNLFPEKIHAENGASTHETGLSTQASLGSSDKAPIILD